MAIRARNLVLFLAAGAVAAYFAYTWTFGGTQSSDVPTLLKTYPSAPDVKRQVIRSRIISLYKHADHYGLLSSALDDPSPLTQALAVDLLTQKNEGSALPKLFAMLNDPRRDPLVTARVATSIARIPLTAPRLTKVVPRLIELTGEAQPEDVRAAAHHALKKLLDTNVVRYGPGTRDAWEEFWKSSPMNVP